MPFNRLFVTAAAGLALAAASILAHAEVFRPLPDQPPIPADNPMTPEKIALGKQLFFDPRLSSDGTVSCNTCHNLMLGATDNRPTSVGVHGRVGGRKSPTLWNIGYMTSQFWDGRVPTLEEQAAGPFFNPGVMDMVDEERLADRIASIPGYRSQFDAVFGEVSYANIAKALSAYQRTLNTPDSPFDRYLKGDEDALSSQALRGMALVREIGCTACHQGVNLAGPDLPMGEPFLQRFPTFTDNVYVDKYDLMADPGRAASTGRDEDRHMFRVPTWRNVALGAPYFHNGRVWTLDEAVRVMAATQLDLTLPENQVADIVAFLDSLTGEIPLQTLPRLPPTPGRSVMEKDFTE